VNHPSRLAALALAVLATVFAWLWLAGRRRAAELELETAKSVTARRTLESELAARVRDIEALRAQMAAEGIVPAVEPHRKAPPPDDSKRLEAVRSLAQAEQRIAALQSALSEARERAGQFEAQAEKLRADSRKLENSINELRDDLDASRRVVEASDAEIRSKAERITQLEASLKAARETRSTADPRAQQAAALIREFADINRRRENTLQSLQRRFRDISDQYRSFALRLDTNRDNPAAAMPDVSRIQSTVQSAEDELRQLNTLNIQAQRLAQKLAVLDK
jgi:chromosome segregation ATPase